jgi:hypothetical protein
MGEKNQSVSVDVEEIKRTKEFVLAHGLSH